MKFVYVEEPNQFTLLEEGIGQFQVKSAKNKVSNSGNEMIELVLDLWDKKGTKLTIYDYLVGTENMAWKIKHFCESVGKSEWYTEGGEIDINLLPGLSGECEIGIEEKRIFNGTEYPEKNKIKNYLEKSEKKDSNIVDDDIPF